MPFRSLAATSLLFLGLAGGLAKPALAQHVVTDNEAGKLTFDALTATPAPVFHRATYRPVSRHFTYQPAAVRSRGVVTAGAVHEASWRRAVSRSSAATLAHVAHHGRARRG